MSEDPLVRSFKIPSNKVNFRRHPRYGTWSVSFDTGGIPDKFRGQFTSFRELYENFNYYLQNRDRYRCSIGDEIKGIE